MAEDLGGRLFTIGVITDTHLNQGEDNCNSPFAVNRLANARMRHVVRELNGQDLAFVINVGDLIHPVPAVPALYEQAAARFHEQVTDLRHPLYLTPGNHDIGDKPNDWAPAAGICDDFVALWEKHFGAHYQSFDHAGMHFVIVDAQIINSGLACEAEQQAWLEADLAANKGKRIFAFCHYPPYFSRPEEEENYDNIGEPGRSWLLGQLEANGVEAMFIGHVHNFWYNRFAATDLYMLPSTSFVRQDYSEMYRARPDADAEAGRNDKPKLGYFLVHVHETGHVIDVVRTYGKTVAPGTPEPVPVDRVPPVHPRRNPHGGFGFDMRQNWMEVVEIPPTGGLDEFDRKEVRNDYPLMALWEMGVRKLRVPLRDLLVDDVRDRMRTLTRHGHEFTLFTFGAPSDRDVALIEANQDIFAAWEIGMNWEKLENIIGVIGDAARRIDLPVYLSRLRSIDELRIEAGHYYHVINQGFLAEDRGQMQDLLSRMDLRGAVDGFVFRLTADRLPWEAVHEASTLASELGVQASVHLRMCWSNPAEAWEDDDWVAARISEAMLAAAVRDNVAVFADTFIDNDRGYFVRNGVLDRLNNPRPAFHVVRYLNGLLSTFETIKPGEVVETADARMVSVQADSRTLVLLLPKEGRQVVLISANDIRTLFGPEGFGGERLVDLVTGRIEPAVIEQIDGEYRIRLSWAAGPVVLMP